MSERFSSHHASGSGIGGSGAGAGGGESSSTSRGRSMPPPERNLMAGRPTTDPSSISPRTAVSASKHSTRLAPSSAAFLHHLHTDPSSHHITLSGSTSRHAAVSAPAPARSPRSIALPFEPTVEHGNSPPPPSTAPLPRRRSVKSATSPVTTTSEAMAGPSTLRPLQRGSSRRARPMTAPAPKTPETEGMPSHEPSPDVEAAGLDLSPRSPGELPQIMSSSTATADSCLVAFEQEESGLDNAMGMMSIAGNGGGNGTGTHVIGRAGRLTIASPGDSPPQLQADSEHSPIEQLSWKTFAQSYANGLFDPNKIPNPPRQTPSPVHPASSHSSPGRSYVPYYHPHPVGSGSGSGSLSVGAASNSSASQYATSIKTDSSGGSNTTMTSTSSAPVSIASSTMPSSAPIKTPYNNSIGARPKAFELENLPTRPASAESARAARPDTLNLSSYSLAAASVRLASTNLRQSDFAPLGMPSPERELLDPLASVMSGESASTLKDSASSDPGSSRYALSRSMSSAIGVTRDPAHLPTIQASPAGTPYEHPDQQSQLPRRLSNPKGGGIVSSKIPPASAPLEKTIEAESTTDYFGAAASASAMLDSDPDSQTSSSTVTGGPTPQGQTKMPDPRDFRKLLPVEDEIQLPPMMTNPSEMGAMYEKLGWLPAPFTPHEAARRKALYRFNILHTAPDVNFDRIAHMAKLVFSTKIVAVVLIDGDMQWYKTESGLGASEATRVSSFCSHTLLLKSGEPFVVLDASLDWRFAKNPNVAGAPHIRFYAGAPLRTSDGYNLGSLCIIDDKPRADFTPRSRLILKEFAAICMREMELWRDKLQLRVRDKIQISMEKFTRECLEMDAESSASKAEAAAKMDHVYTRAAQLVCQTLDMDGCFILDISEFEKVEIETVEGTKSVYRADPYFSENVSPVLERSDTLGPIPPFPVLATIPTAVPTRPLTSSEHEKLSEFLLNNRDGRIFENIAPSWIRHMFPSDMRYGMVVPVFGVNQQPFAMIAAYTTNKAKQYLEGYELQFQRAIGVIILSAVLRRRMVLADKTKSVLISSVSHELRTPLHGILAAAELLSDTNLDPSQTAFLKTVQTCGNSLIETVNHVLDFTKLSGAAEGGSGTGGSIKLSKVNLANLVEQTVEGCWIGQRARFFMGDSEIGSFYAPPSAPTLLPREHRRTVAKEFAHVETVVDIGPREKGWMVRCEKGGLRRVLMNLVGNSLKFTTDGYVQVTLRELPHPPGSKTIPVEMAVIDTGKGIGKDFLNNQLFHPFSQENPLQAGTGLGLAIVNSIVRSPTVDGKVDVWSVEGMGTEIRVSFDVEVIDEEDDTSSSSASSSSVSLSPTFGKGRSISLAHFDSAHRGQTLAQETFAACATNLGLELDDQMRGDILVINEEVELLASLKNEMRPLIFLYSFRNNESAALRDEINRAGGSCQILHKPVGPNNFIDALRTAVSWLEDPTAGRSFDKDRTDSAAAEVERPPISRNTTDESTASTETTGSGASGESNSTISELAPSANLNNVTSPHDRAPLTRRRSEEKSHSTPMSNRPAMAPRGSTYHAPIPRKPSVARSDDGSTTTSSPQPGSPTSQISTISLADGGVMLKAATLPPSAPRQARIARVMVVEDNVINRRVLGAFLKKKGYQWAEAVDGQAGVELFDSTPAHYWDVILMDISMPVMNGHEATRAIRRIESSRRRPSSESTTSSSSASTPLTSPGPSQHSPLADHANATNTRVVIPPQQVVEARAKIFALTGLATSEDKREAFGSGVDGYLVKPVSLASLDLIFKKIGF